MQFEPIGGFPALIREEDAVISEKTLESRGFATTNIVDIANIMQERKKQNLYTAFGSEEENAIDLKIQTMFDDNPHQYEGIGYKNISKKLPRMV